MKIVICGSIDSTYKIKKISDELKKMGHETEIPLTSQRILNGELTMEEFLAEKGKNGDGTFRRKIRDDVIKRYYEIIKKSDAIFLVNVEKNGISGYIGGNTFLEMGFAHVLGKKIFLLNDIPEIGYTDELKAMEPVVLRGDIGGVV